MNHAQAILFDGKLGQPTLNSVGHIANILKRGDPNTGHLKPEFIWKPDFLVYGTVLDKNL